MSNWKEQSIDIGIVRHNEKKLIKFISTKHLDIARVQTGCSMCTKFIDYKNNELILQYTGEERPYHLKNINSGLYISKFVHIYLEDGSIDTLTFNATLM